jgi:hypothetical protein
MEKMNQQDNHSSRIFVPGAAGFEMKAPRLSYLVEAFDENGELVWDETIHNLVTNAGATFNLETFFRGTSYTASWYVGLVSNASFTAYNATDTMASHSGWQEFTDYSQSNRVAATFGSAAVNKAITASAASSFSVTGAGTLKGAFLTTNNTKGGTTGTLYSVSNFTQGDRPVDAGYTVNVTPQVSIT